jgi:hypothetical protein
MTKRPTDFTRGQATAHAAILAGLYAIALALAVGFSPAVTDPAQPQALTTALR